MQIGNFVKLTISPATGTVIALSQKRLVQLVVLLHDNVEGCILLWIKTNLPQYILSQPCISRKR